MSGSIDQHFATDLGRIKKAEETAGRSDVRAK
jgi:hypothetical protein